MLGLHVSWKILNWGPHFKSPGPKRSKFQILYYLSQVFQNILIHRCRGPVYISVDNFLFRAPVLSPGAWKVKIFKTFWARTFKIWVHMNILVLIIISWKNLVWDPCFESPGPKRVTILRILLFGIRSSKYICSQMLSIKGPSKFDWT